MRGLPHPLAVTAQAIAFADLDGFSDEDHAAAFRVFAASCKAIVKSTAPLRPACEIPQSLIEICQKALAGPAPSAHAARQFFETYFTPYRVPSKTASRQGFLTGYYEPVVEGALEPDAEFSAPILARPDDLVTLPQGESFSGADGPLQAARAGATGLEAYPDRAAIEAGALQHHERPLVFLRDKVEAFFIHVQGSARVRLRDGTELRLLYAGRNGHSYTSIGRILIEEEGVPAAEAGLTGLKRWLRAKGLVPGEPGAALMSRNKSYIFFAVTEILDPHDGPIGGQGVSLTPLRSIAVDRTLWSYGLPFWIDAEIPWRSTMPERFRRLMTAQDTGSAILGAARADLFFGSGDAAGALAGALRHPASMTVLLPRDASPSDFKGFA